MNAETITQCCKTVRARTKKKSKTATFAQPLTSSLAMETIRGGGEWQREQQSRVFHLRREVELGHSRTGRNLYFSLRLPQPCRKQSAQRTHKKKCSGAKKMGERLNKKLEINKKQHSRQIKFHTNQSFIRSRAVQARNTSRMDRDRASCSLLILPRTEAPPAGQYATGTKEELN